MNISVFESFPKLHYPNLLADLKKSVQEDKHKIVVLDDDPTGVQTLHDVPVFTDWSIDSIREGFQEKGKLFYILTNSRSFSVVQTTTAHKEIIHNILSVSKEQQRPFLIISRSDSTLRGHYPLETELLREGIEKAGVCKVDGEILCPYFKEGGRFTFGDVHYVKYGDELVPAGETEFAKDKTFGYHASNLRDYIEEKTHGAFSRDKVVSISIEELRSGQIDNIADKLCQVKNFGKIIVNAITQDDVRIFVLALYQALARGKYFLFRTAAPFVKEMGAVTDAPLLTAKELFHEQSNSSGNGGIIVVGSHTAKTTAQLEELHKLPALLFRELNSDLVLDPEAFHKEVEQVLQWEDEQIAKGKTVVIYTKRQVLTLPDDTKEAALARSVKISDAVQSLVGKLKVKPAYVLAKGGITSSDVGTKALRVHKAWVLGQICPGVPVWQTDSSSRFPGIPYVIFPGNVGTKDTLFQAVQTLESRK